MIRYVLKRKKVRLNLKKILSFYYYTQVFSSTGFNNKYILSEFTNVHTVALPKRQQYFSICNTVNSKLVNFSSCYILKIAGYTVKFFKRSHTSAATIILFFRQFYLNLFKNIFMYLIKNLTYRQICFFKKLSNLISLNIYYLVHKKSYIPRFFPPRRLKRRVLRLIGSR